MFFFYACLWTSSCGWQQQQHHQIFGKNLINFWPSFRLSWFSYSLRYMFMAPGDFSGYCIAHVFEDKAETKTFSYWTILNSRKNTCIWNNCIPEKLTLLPMSPGRKPCYIFCLCFTVPYCFCLKIYLGYFWNMAAFLMIVCLIDNTISFCNFLYDSSYTDDSQLIFQETCHHLYFICKNIKGITFLYILKRQAKLKQINKTNIK